jgi:hypothetical protein
VNVFWRKVSCTRCTAIALWLVVAGLLMASREARAQEPPYFVTYSHAMEEPGNLEVEFKGTQASPKDASAFGGGTVEFEYGAKAWWTTEVYLSGQTTANDSTIFTGFRWENRFRPLLEEHRVNPVLYFEYEDTSADRSFLEIVGNDGVGDLEDRNDEARRDVERELEMKLILSSNAKGWNVSENFITEKNLQNGEAFEFGYALAASRPLTLRAGVRECAFCRENFAAGAEMYGGLGTTDSFGLRDTSHYVAPALGWNIPRGPTLTFSPGFGLNDNSMKVLWRVGAQYEFQQFFGRFRHTRGMN